ALARGGSSWLREECGCLSSQHFTVRTPLVVPLHFRDRESRRASHRPLSYRGVVHEDDWAWPSRTRSSPDGRENLTRTSVAALPSRRILSRTLQRAHRARRGCP